MERRKRWERRKMKNYSNLYYAMLGGVFFIYGFTCADAFGFMTSKFISFSIFALMIFILSINWMREVIKRDANHAKDNNVGEGAA